MWLKRVLILFLSIALSTANANAEEASTQLQNSNFTLAYQGPLSGPEAATGVAQLQGVKFAIAKFNAANPGKIVRLIEVDDQGNPVIANQVAPAVAANLSIIGLVGPAYSGATKASLPYYKPAGLPLITPSASNEDLTNPSNFSNGIPIFHRVVRTYFYRNPNISTSEGSVLIRRAVTQTPLNKIFIVRDATEDGIVNDVIATLKALGSTNDSLITLLSSNPTESDFNQAAATLKARGAANVIFAGYSSATAVGLIKALKLGGYSGKFSVTSVTNPTEFKTLAGSYGNNVELTMEHIPLKDASATLASEFVSKMRTQPGDYATEAINATNVFLAGIKAGVSTRQAMSAFIDSYKGTGVAGNTIQFTANGELTNPSWGTYTITNSQLVYKGLISVATFAKKLPQTITFAPPTSLTSAQFPYTLTATASSGLALTLTTSTPAICTVSGMTLTLKIAGTCTLVASQAGNSIYNPAPSITRSITLTKASQTITFAPPTSLTSAQSPYTLSATASSGLAVTITNSTPGICHVFGIGLYLKMAGTCTLVASQAGNTIYNPAPSITRSITLTKAPQTITFSPAESMNLSQSPYTLTATASSGLTVSFTSTTPSICTVSGNLLTVRAAGSCSVAANQTGNSTYASAPSVSRAITTTKAPQTIAFAPPVSLTNAQSPYTLTATASSGLAVTVASSTPDICTVSALRLTLVAAGTCTLVASQAGSSVYERAMNVQARIAITGNPTFTVGTKYQTGRYSIGVAINRSTAYVTNPNDGTISVIDLKNSTSTKFTIGGNPWCIQINGENAYVSDLSGNRISIVSLLTQKVVGIINVVGPYNFIIERGKIYVAGGHQNEGGLDNKLSVFELSSLRLINSVPIGGNPTSVAVMGNLAFIANSASTYVSVIDLSTFTLVENIFLPSAPISVFATNDNLYVTLPNRNALAVIKLENRQLVDEISVGTSPFGVSVYKNSYAFVTNSSSGNLSIVNLSTKMELARITISDYPHYVVFDEGAAYVLSSGDGQNLGALTKIRMMWL